MPSNPLILSITQTSNVPILLGGTSSFVVTIQNTSSTDRLYNLSLSLTLPDGMSFSSATLPSTSLVSNTDGSSLTSWISIKDLAPQEAPYLFTLTLKSNTSFKNGTVIPFGYTFTGISVQSQVDTMPRGSYDIGNQVFTNTLPMTFLTVAFYGTVTTASKVLKGAGTASNLQNYTKVYTATYTFYNNTRSASTLNIQILLPDGIRYLSNITTSGTNASFFTNPTLSTIILDGITYTQLFYSSVTLSQASITILNFKYAVWNRYQNNLGNFITHGTPFLLPFTMSNLDATFTTQTSFIAMDILITTTNTPSICDVEDLITYTYTYEVGEYYNIQAIVIHYLLPDGIDYLSSASPPVSATDDPSLKGYELIYNFPLASANSLNRVTISAQVSRNYRYKKDNSQNALPVVSFDRFTATTKLSGTLMGPNLTVTDSASTSSSIQIASIVKTFLKAYYQDGSPKSISVLAPLDLAEYQLTFDATLLKAIQKEIDLTDFFPLSASPIDNLNYTFTGYFPPALTPLPISPHGQNFYYGDIPGGSFSAITFKVPIASLGGTGQNNNLLKLRGINTLGVAYSNRSQVSINIGSPNLSLKKSVSGPHTTAIQAGEVYTYTIIIANSSTLHTETDAFSFNVTDTLSTWFTLSPNSFQVSGTGISLPPTVVGNTIVWPIQRLAPGQSCTFTYQVTINLSLAPGVTITTAVTNANPYSQPYTQALPNFQYTNQSLTASTTLTSLGITLTKTSNSALFKVGSFIVYTLNFTIPQGTTAYDVQLTDTLPSGQQIYIGPATRNGTSITPTINTNVITFPSEGMIDARTLAKLITYSFVARITNGTKAVGALTSTQTNTGRVFYKQSLIGSTLSVSKNLVVTLQHPNIALSLSATDRTTSIYNTQSAIINLNSIMDFKLVFKNNSLIPLVNGTLVIPIDPSFNFINIKSTVQGSAIYNPMSRQIIVTIPNLDASASGFLTFTVSPLATLYVGTLITTQARALSYYNDVSTTKVYGGELSNLFTCNLAPGTSLLPLPADKLNDSTSYRVTRPGGTVTITNIFQNTGGGYDNYTLTISPVTLPYVLAINEIIITTVPINTLYQANLPILTHVPPGQTYPITLTTTLPLSTPLGTRYDFVVKVQSLTSPYPQKTVLNIDPN